MTMTSQLKLTPAQKAFLSRLHIITAGGAVPKDYKPFGELWRIQHRTMNYCARAGFIVKAGVCRKTGNSEYIVAPVVVEALKLPAMRIAHDLIRRRRRRSSCTV